VIDPDEARDLRVARRRCAQALDHEFDVEQHAAPFRIAHQALHPEHDGQSRAARHRHHAMQAGRGVDDELAGREPIERDALFFGIAMRPRGELAAALGCELDENGFVVAGADRQTSVDRVYAVGNCTEAKQNVPMAIADGALAGALINHRLVEEGVVQPVAV